MRKKFDINDKVVIITGGAGFLGVKHAEVVLEFGGIPILLDIDIKKDQRNIEGNDAFNTRAEYIFCDITDQNQVLKCKKDILKKFGKIDVLINNASINPKVGVENGENLSRLENFSIDQWDLELKVGLTGAMICSKVFGIEMARNGKGVILNIASDLGVIAPDQRIYKEEGLLDYEQATKPVTYSVIKHGLIGLTKYLATYWADKGIRSNSISPGGIYNNQNENFVKKLSNLIPMGRMAFDEEIKGAVIYLISDASSFVTGQNIIIDGGRSCW